MGRASRAKRARRAAGPSVSEAARERRPALSSVPEETWVVARARALRPGYRAAGAVGGSNAGSAPAGVRFRS